MKFLLIPSQYHHHHLQPSWALIHPDDSHSNFYIHQGLFLLSIPLYDAKNVYLPIKFV